MRQIARMTKQLTAFFAAFFLLTAPATAQELDGTWAFQIDDASIFVFTLDEREDGTWHGTWIRPDRFRGNGVVFSQFRGSETVETTVFRWQDDVLELRFAPTQAAGSTDVLRFRSTGEYQAELSYAETGLDPFPLVRVIAGTELGPFSDERIYDRDNAVVEPSYDPADEPVVEAPAIAEEAEEGTGFADILDLPASADENSVDDVTDDVTEVGDVAEAMDQAEATMNEAGPQVEDAAPAEDERETLIGSDFLDGLGDPAPMSQPLDEVADISARACSDLDRGNLPSSAALEALWGDDYESIGVGLDIRDYQMANGDVARVTILDERIYLNSCGPQS